MRYPSLYNPKILGRQAYQKPLHVFLCGPGLDSERHDFRKSIRSFLREFPGVRVDYGEDIENFAFLKKGDLQTLEAQFAHVVDFTVLILESPGSIAELGTFSMIRNIRPRLFVMVPSRFFGSKSYINRGPLSLIASEHLNNIIYFDERNPTLAVRSLEMPITLFKFCRHASREFERLTVYGFFENRENADYYGSKFEPIKARFIETIVFCAILLLDQPTFPEITFLTRLNPNDIRNALSGLFKKHKITKIPGKRYSAQNGFFDNILDPLNTTILSRVKASLKAVA